MATTEFTYQYSNTEIAAYFDEIAERLEAQQANEFRVRAYRQAAAMLRTLARPVQTILAEEGPIGLQKLPTIGRSLAHAIEALSTTGHIDLLTQLRGEVTPIRVLDTVPGIGPILASRIHEQLHISSLPELQAAAYDGRLEQVSGFGAGRLRAVRESLAGRFRQLAGAKNGATLLPMQARTDNQPPVSDLLNVDQEYRAKAQADRLPKIAPRQFNPTGAAWLPILHTTRGALHYTALFSNTARAHALGTTNDWVVIYRDDHGGSGQWTVLTARFGACKGKRIVSGREGECEEYYRQLSAPATVA
ncbi:MAG: hypothetical protein KDE19_18050 [Caldilineaceae bacterium]|nr:hypothetical protein [Caldilineaceae bacterium]